MTAAAGNPDILGADFVRTLEVLRRRLDIRARSGRGGEHASDRRGSSSEFKEHRSYEPGDDLRHIDWAAYARTGEPVLKVFRAEEDVVVRVLCDASGSLDYGKPLKFDTVRHLAAAICFMALARSERAQVFVASAASISETAPVRGRAGLPEILRLLSGAVPRGANDFAKAVETVVKKSQRPGMLVAISDFFDPGPVLRALDRAAASGHDVALLHVTAPEEIEPTFDGDWALEDTETGGVIELTVDARAIEAYLTRFAGLCEDLRAFARRTRGPYIRVRSDEALEAIVRRFVARSID